MFENGIEPEDSVIPTVFKFTLLQSLFVVNSMHRSVIQWETNSLSRRTTPCSILWKCWICWHWSPWSANWSWRMATRSHDFFWWFFLTWLDPETEKAGFAARKVFCDAWLGLTEALEAIIPDYEQRRTLTERAVDELWSGRHHMYVQVYKTELAKGLISRGMVIARKPPPPSWNARWN